MAKPNVGQTVSVELTGIVQAVGGIDGSEEGHVDIKLEDGRTVSNVPTEDLKVHLPKKHEEKEEKAKK